MMKMPLVLFAVWLALLSACTSAAPTISPVPASPLPVLTKTPVPTLAATSTPTPSHTPAPTPVTLTGSLVIVADNELRLISADGANSKVILSKAQFETSFPALGKSDTVPYWSSVISPDGNKILVYTCTLFSTACNNKRLYISSLDLAHTVTLRTFSGGLLEWAPSSDKLMMQSATDARIKTVFSVAGDSFGKINNLPGSQAAFWSFDGSQIYYYDQKVWYVINSDGSQKKALKCDLCANVPDPSSYAVAQSPDGQSIAIGYMDGTIIIASSDLVSFKMSMLGSYVNKLYWSPNSTRLAVDLRTNANQSDIVILNQDGAFVKKLARPEDVLFMNTCGWSPDSQSIDYLGLGSSGNDLYIQPLAQPVAIHRLSLHSENISCPIWLPANP